MSEGTEEATTLILDTQLVTSSVVFLIYDHLLTFGDEARYIWSPSLNKSAFFFTLNRYVGLLANISALVFIHWTSIDSGTCYKVNLVHQITLIVTQVIVCLIISMRIYALYGCSKRVMWGLLAYASALIGVIAWSMTGQSVIEGQTIHESENSCHLSVDHNTAIRLAICWEVLFAYDTTIFIMTLYKTWRTRRSLVTIGAGTLVSLLLRDGAIYFMLMALSNLSNILTFYFAPPFLRGRLSTFASCLSVTLVSRMMLNLHKVHAESGVMSTITGIMFSPGKEDTGNTNDTLDTMLEVELGNQRPQSYSGTMILAVP